MLFYKTLQGAKVIRLRQNTLWFAAGSVICNDQNLAACAYSSALKGEEIEMFYGNFTGKMKRQRANAVAHGTIGLDIGTSNIVVFKRNGSKVSVKMESNVFLTVPSLPQTRNILTGNGIKFLDINESLYIIGNHAKEFAGIMGGQTRQPMENGIVNLGEDEGIRVIHTMLDRMLEPPEVENEPLWFSVPGNAIDAPGTAIFNESIFKTYLKNLGYSPQPINEGMAVLISEQTDGHVTGIGISIGGGMCNICCSYLSIPVVTYSILMGGDYIDNMVAGSVGETPDRIKSIKEKELDLSSQPKNNIEHGLHACYDSLFSTLAESLEQVLSTSDNVPKLRQAIPIVLSGGTVLVAGSRDKFASALNKVTLPLEISDIVIAANPLLATAKGAFLTTVGKDSIKAKK